MHADIFTWFYFGVNCKTARSKIQSFSRFRSRSSSLTTHTTRKKHKLQWWMAYNIIRFCAQIALSHVHWTSLRALNRKPSNLNYLYPFSSFWFSAAICAACIQVNHFLMSSQVDWLIMFNFPFQMHSALLHIFFVLFPIYQTVLSLFLRNPLFDEEETE